LSAIASVRRLCDHTRGRPGRHDNSPMAAGKGHGRSSSPQLAIIVEAAHMRVAGTIHGLGRALSFGQTLRPHRPRALYRNLSCQGLRELSIDWLFYTQREGSSMRINGTVKFFNGAKGFGFISPADGSKDVFVHATALERAGIRSLNEGDKVSFVLED